MAGTAPVGGQGRAGVALLALLAAAALAAPAAAQDTGTADLILRYPPQVTFHVWGDGATYNEILLEAEPGDALNATLLVRARGDNTLQTEQDYTVTMRLRSGADNTTTLARANGTFAPGTSGNQRITLNGTLPDDLRAGAYTLHFHLETGAWDPNPANNDPGPVALRIGAPTLAARDDAFRAAHLIGPIAFAALLAVPVTHRLLQHRPAWAEKAARLQHAAERLVDRWHQAEPARRSRLVQRGVILALLVAFLVTLALQRGLALGLRGLADAAWIAAFAALAHLVFGTLARARRSKARQREEGRAPRDLRAPWAENLRGTLAPASATLAVVLFAALFWQQLAAVTTFFRWPEIGTLDAFVVIGLRVGAVYALIALGYTLVYGVLKFINFAHGEIFMWGAFLIWVFAVDLRIAFPLAVLLGVAATGALGAVIERVAYRPLRGASRLAPLVTAIALSVLLQGLAQFFFGASTSTYRQAGGTYRGSALQEFFGRRIIVLGQTLDALAVTALVASVLLMWALHAFIKHSRTGRAMRAVSDDLVTARTLGIRVDRIITITFVIGSALAAVGGLLYALRFDLRFDMGLLVGIKAFTAAVVGGIGNIHGAFLGGFLIGLAENVGSQFIDDRFQRVIAFVILVGFLLFKPRGIMPTTAEVRK